MTKSPIGVKGAGVVITLATLVAVVGAIIFIAVNKDDLASVWRPHNVVILVMIAIIIPISCVCSPIAGAIQAACCWRSVDEKYHPGLSKSQRAQKGAKYALACTGVCICGLLTCGEGAPAEPTYPENSADEENPPNSMRQPSSPPAAVLAGPELL
jgi:hypothetical protein